MALTPKPPGRRLRGTLLSSCSRGQRPTVQACSNAGHGLTERLRWPGTGRSRPLDLTVKAMRKASRALASHQGCLLLARKRVSGVTGAPDSDVGEAESFGTMTTSLACDGYGQADSSRDRSARFRAGGKCLHATSVCRPVIDRPAVEISARSAILSHGPTASTPQAPPQSGHGNANHDALR